MALPQQKFGLQYHMRNEGCYIKSAVDLYTERVFFFGGGGGGGGGIIFRVFRG